MGATCEKVHRPDPLAHPAQTAEVLDALVAEGLVRQVGVSNYYPHQLRALQRYLKTPIVSNQVEISLLHLDSIYEGRLGGPAGRRWRSGEMGFSTSAWS